MKIGIVVALYPEAKKIIEALKLISLPFSEFPVFVSQDKNIVLVISGVGKIASASATSFLLSHFSCDAVTNFGFAGGKGELGSFCFIDDIIDDATEKHFFPDVSWSLFPENRTILRTLDQPSRLQDYKEWVDMEASGFFQSASFFLPLHRIFVCKILSDNASGEKIDLPKLDDTLRKAVQEFLEFLQKIEPFASSFFSEDDEEMIQVFFEKYRFSITEERMLKKCFQSLMIQKNRDLFSLLKDYDFPLQENKKQLSEKIFFRIFSDFKNI